MVVNNDTVTTPHDHDLQTYVFSCSTWSYDTHTHGGGSILAFKFKGDNTEKRLHQGYLGVQGFDPLPHYRRFCIKATDLQSWWWWWTRFLTLTWSNRTLSVLVHQLYFRPQMCLWICGPKPVGWVLNESNADRYGWLLLHEDADCLRIFGRTLSAGILVTLR